MRCKLHSGTRLVRETLMRSPVLLSDAAQGALMPDRQRKHVALSRKRPKHVTWTKLLVAFLLHIGTVFAANPAQAAASKTITLNNNVNQAILEDDGIPTNRLVRLRSENESFSVRHLCLSDT